MAKLQHGWLAQIKVHIRELSAVASVSWNLLLIWTKKLHLIGEFLLGGWRQENSGYSLACHDCRRVGASLSSGYEWKSALTCSRNSTELTGISGTLTLTSQTTTGWQIWPRSRRSTVPSRVSVALFCPNIRHQKKGCILCMSTFKFFEIQRQWWYLRVKKDSSFFDKFQMTFEVSASEQAIKPKYNIHTPACMGTVMILLNLRDFESSWWIMKRNMTAKLGVCHIHEYVENKQFVHSKPAVRLVHECVYSRDGAAVMLRKQPNPSVQNRTKCPGQQCGAISCK